MENVYVGFTKEKSSLKENRPKQILQCLARLKMPSTTGCNIVLGELEGNKIVETSWESFV